MTTCLIEFRCGMFVYVLKKRQDGLIAFYREKKENLEFNGFKQHLILHLKEIK